MTSEEFEMLMEEDKKAEYETDAFWWDAFGDEEEEGEYEDDYE